MSCLKNAEEIAANCKTIRETEDFLLEKVGTNYWLTNRSLYNLKDDDDRSKHFNRWNDGIAYEAIALELAESETDAEFNARCLTYFGFGYPEDRIYFPEPKAAA